MKKRIIIISSLTLFLIIIFIISRNSIFLFNILKNFERGPLKEKSIQIEKHTIYYLEAGKGETIVMVHGYGGDKDNWTRFARQIIDKYHVIALDLPGFGDSTRNWDLNYSIKIQTNRLNEIVKKLGLKEFHIIANSMGGHISSVFTIMFQEKVKTLCLVDPAGTNSKIKSHFLKSLEKNKNPLIVHSIDDYDRLMNYVFYKPPYIPGIIKNHFAIKAVENKPFNEKVMEDIKNEILNMTLDLKKIKIPTLIIWGDTDRVIHISNSKIFNKEIANSSVVIMEKCGHLPMLERPEETAQHYLKFLEGK